MMYQTPSTNDDYLEHYGRLGMKWYQHIFGEHQSHAKYATKDKKARREIEAKEREKARRDAILKSPKELNNRVNPIHLHLDFPVYRNVAS